MSEEEIKKAKNKANRNKLFVRIMAAILAILMLAAALSTCVFYLINL